MNCNYLTQLKKSLFYLKWHFNLNLILLYALFVLLIQGRRLFDTTFDVLIVTAFSDCNWSLIFP